MVPTRFGAWGQAVRHESIEHETACHLRYIWPAPPRAPRLSGYSCRFDMGKTGHDFCCRRNSGRSMFVVADQRDAGLNINARAEGFADANQAFEPAFLQHRSFSRLAW